MNTTYFMIIMIWWSNSAIEVVMYPMDNYEHCMEQKNLVRESLSEQLDFLVSTACPPLQR